VNGDPPRPPSEPGSGPPNTTAQAGEEELRAAYEAELSRITSADMMLQAAVSLLNIGSHRLGPIAPGPAGEAGAGAGVQRDLEQVRDAIDGVRALLGILDRRLPRELGPLRDALSQLQMAYAREVQASGGPSQSAASEQGGEAEGQAGGAGGGQAGGAGGGQPGQAESPQREQPAGPGPAEASGRLWVPGR
jgi:hypothetical protein